MEELKDYPLILEAVVEEGIEENLEYLYSMYAEEFECESCGYEGLNTDEDGMCPECGADDWKGKVEEEEED